MAKQYKKTEVESLVMPAAKLKAMSVMGIAIWCSVAFHLVILSIHFQPELKKLRDNLPVLEVVLVNAKTSAAPDKAEVYAQANLDRGGNTDLDRKMKTALPALKQQEAEFTLKPEPKTKQGESAAQQEAELTREQKRVAELEKHAQELMTQINSNKVVESQPVQNAAVKESQTGNQATPNKKLNIDELTAKALEMNRLEALISKQQDEYQKRPKRKFMGGRTKEYRYALYEESVRQKVEKIGTLNYPEAAKDMRGQVEIIISINLDGSLESVEISRSSGNKVLDEAAKHIVELGAPYARFPDDMRKDVEVLSMVRTMLFTKEGAMAAE